MKRAMSCDFDGTLYFLKHDDQETPGLPYYHEDLDAIRSFQRHGGLVGVCTGRSLRGILEAGVPAGVSPPSFDFYILASGSLILDRYQKILYQHTVPREIVQKIYYTYCHQIQTIIHANDTVYQIPSSLSQDDPLQETIPSFDAIPGNRIYGLSFGTRSRHQAETVSREINRQYGKYVTARVNVQYVDMVSAHTTKGTAIRFVKSALGIDLMGAIGDSFNDIPMLDSADRSYTFFSSPDEIRQKADVVVSRAAEALQDLEQITFDAARKR